jgi:hypothetical protein
MATPDVLRREQKGLTGRELIERFDSAPAHGVFKLQDQRCWWAGFFVDDNARDRRRLVIGTSGIRRSKAGTCIWIDPLLGSSICEGRLRLAAD